MNIKEKIKNYLENPEIYKRSLMIDSSWGSGKSTLVKKILSGCYDKIDSSKVKYYKIIDICDIDKNYDFLSNIYYFSNIINTEKSNLEIENKDNYLVKQEGFLNKGKSLFKRAKIVLRKNSKWLDVFESAHTFAKVGNDLYKSWTNHFLSNENFEKFVLVIDEVERCADPVLIEWVFLKLSKLQENQNLRIIIICNSKKFTEVIKEKMIDWKDKISSVSLSISSLDQDEIKKELVLPELSFGLNFRVIEKFLIIKKIIDEKWGLIVKKNLTNNVQKEKIKDLENYIYNLLSEYYDEDSNNKKYFIELSKNDKNYITVEEIENMDYKKIDESLESIYRKYKIDYSSLLTRIEKFAHKNIVDDKMLIMTLTQKKQLEMRFFEDLKMIFTRNNYGFFEYKSIRFNIRDTDDFDIFSVISYVNFIKNNFSKNKNSPKMVSHLLFNIYDEEINYFRRKSTLLEEKLILWDEYEKTLKNRLNYIETINFLPRFMKKKLKLKLKKNFKVMFKELLYLHNENLTKEDLKTKSRLWNFNLKYNSQIIKIIYKLNNENLYTTIKIFKENMLHYQTLISIESELALMKSKVLMKNHNLNDNRIVYDYNNNENYKKLNKQNHILKIKDEYFN